MDGFGRKDNFSIVCACIRRYPGGYRIIVGCRMLPQTRNCLCFFAFKRCERRGGVAKTFGWSQSCFVEF